jgi:hypothetical protein
MKSKILISLCIIILSHTLVTAKGPVDMAAIFHQLNRPDYCTDILPHDFSYLVKLLEYGKNTKKDSEYVERVLRLYIRLVKGAPCINGYAFSDLLTRLPDLLSYCCAVKNKPAPASPTVLDMDMFDRFKESVNNVLYNRFLTDYDAFKKNPDDFLHDISQQVLDLAQEEIAALQLRNVLVRFLEISLGKLVWSADESEKAWESTKKIATDLTNLTQQAIIEDVNELDDLFWSLTYRFSFFIDIFASSLPQTFYETVQNDITHKKLLLVNLEEQQDWLESKEKYLTRTINGSKAKMFAYQDHGILTN